jgi:phage internal scaffolding protein
MKVTNVVFRTGTNYDVDAVSAESALVCLDESLAVQSERDESDINTIVKRFGLGVPLPEGVRMPQYGDFTGVTDYQSALNLVMQADDNFMQFPADVRARFENNPANMIAFLENDSNRDEAAKLGLIVSPSPAVKTASAVETTDAGE